jgi:tripartite-type tricarboxylate transporter receptor subunit TctC
MRRRHLLGATMGSSLALPALHARAQGTPWRPDRPINLIVPWAAGGSTDQMARIVAVELEEALGQKWVVVNQPGASGSIGTRNVQQAAKDGYTWAAGAAIDIGCYRVLGLLDSGLDDWHLFFVVANVNTIAVNPSAPFRDFGQLVEAMKARNNIAVATAGQSSAGRNVMEAVRAAAPGLQYRNAPYDGGNPAVLATVAGETQVGAALLVEMAEMIRGRRLRPLAVQAESAVTLQGFGEIPSVRQWLPNIPTPLNYFGVWCPKDTPAPIVEAVGTVWQEKIAHSARLREYAEQKAALFTPIALAEAREKAWVAVRQTAWLYHDAGQSRAAPDTVGIPRL